jgi:AcrR family transcriptional regulator
MTPPGLRERKKQKTRWAIQEHALRLFVEQGYDATTVEQIAAAAEVSPSTFFRYFRTKEDVVIEDEYDQIMISLMEAAPADLTPLGAVRHAVRVAFGEMPASELSKLESRMRLTLSVSALRARTLENLAESVVLLAEPIARRAGRDPADRWVRALAGACVGVVLVATQEWLDGRTGMGFVESLDEALGYLESGFASQGPA